MPAQRSQEPLHLKGGQLGPFVDSNHPLIREGDIDMTADDIFLSKVAVPLRDLMMNERTDLSVAMMPSIRDLVTHKNVYPQGAGVGPAKFQNWQVRARQSTAGNPADDTFRR